MELVELSDSIGTEYVGLFFRFYAILLMHKRLDKHFQMDMSLLAAIATPKIQKDLFATDLPLFPPHSELYTSSSSSRQTTHSTSASALANGTRARIVPNLETLRDRLSSLTTELETARAHHAALLAATPDGTFAEAEAIVAAGSAPAASLPDDAALERSLSQFTAVVREFNQTFNSEIRLWLQSTASSRSEEISDPIGKTASELLQLHTAGVAAPLAHIREVREAQRAIIKAAAAERSEGTDAFSEAEVIRLKEQIAILERAIQRTKQDMHTKKTTTQRM